jgi:hypothetical protein
VLEIVRTSWLLWRAFLVRDDRTATIVGTVTLWSSWWQLSGRVAAVSVGGRNCILRRTQWFGREYVLEGCDGGHIATVRRPRALDETLVVSRCGSEWSIVPKWNAVGQKDFEVFERGRAIGGMSCRSRILRFAAADLPNELSNEIQMLMICLALQNWRTSLSSA